MAPKIDPQKLASLVSSGAAPLLGGAFALGSLMYGANNCLYNVDAGFRAIKFNRWSGVGDMVQNNISFLPLFKNSTDHTQAWPWDGPK